MLIRKEFSVESAHIVRNCTSHRCSHSIHGHSARIELFLKSYKLDNAGMVYDFGLMKGTIKQFIDSMDHCYILCNKDDQEFKDFIKDSCHRWIELPFNPSAEYLSMFIFRFVEHIMDHTHTNNGEGTVSIESVRYHETATGYAQCDWTDIGNIWNPSWDSQISYSAGVVEDWSDELKGIIFDGKCCNNPVIEQQIKLE